MLRTLAASIAVLSAVSASPKPDLVPMALPPVEPQGAVATPPPASPRTPARIASPHRRSAKNSSPNVASTKPPAHGKT
jgi:hypothetical protein